MKDKRQWTKDRIAEKRSIERKETNETRKKPTERKK
jgi:hypothetical protein